MRASPIPFPIPPARANRDRTPPWARRGPRLGAARAVAAVLLGALAAHPCALGQAPPGGGFVWAYVGLVADPAPAPDGVALLDRSFAEGAIAGRIAIEVHHDACREVRVGSWGVPLTGPLARGDALTANLTFTIDSDACRDGRSSGVAVEVGPRPAFLTDATAPGGSLAGYRFVDAFGASMPNAAATDSSGGRPLQVPQTVTLVVTSDPRAADELAEFRVATGVPGYAFVVAYLFRAVARP